MSTKQLNVNQEVVEPIQDALTLKILRLKKVEGNVNFPVLFEKDEIFGKSNLTQKTEYPQKKEEDLNMDGFGYSEVWKVLEEFGFVFKN
jgi:hypothetical protein